MMPAFPLPAAAMQVIRRFAVNRPRIVLALVVGVAAGILLPGQWRTLARVMIGWNAAVWFYLCLVGWLLAHASEARARRMAEQENEGAVAVLTILSVGAAVSLAAIVVELATARNVSPADRVFHYVLTAMTVLGSWALLAVVFMFHYAHLFYRSPKGRPALQFPGDETPDFWDFLYFSVTIAVAAQTSDVVVASGAARKVVLAQSVLSFLFNAAILGLSINIAAGVAGG